MKLSQQDQAEVTEQIELVMSACRMCLAMTPFMVRDKNYHDPELRPGEFRLGRFVIRDTLASKEDEA